jgi:quinol monooxygenase YgiN
MYGLIVKLMLKPGKRDEMIEVLKSSSGAMPGCHSYLVMKDSSDADVLWISEVWDSEQSHKASLDLPAVRASMPQAKALVADFERVAITDPVWDAAQTVSHQSAAD